MKQILSGINVLHENGFVHRNISLYSILLDYKHRCKLSNFSNAQQLHVRKDHHYDNERSWLREQRTRITTFKTTGHTILNSKGLPGKYGFQSPELLLGADYNPYKADIFSIGIVFFCLCSGRLPFGQVKHTLRDIFHLQDTGCKTIIESYDDAIDLPACAYTLMDMMLSPEASRPSARFALSHTFFA